MWCVNVWTLKGADNVVCFWTELSFSCCPLVSTSHAKLNEWSPAHTDNRAASIFFSRKWLLAISHDAKESQQQPLILKESYLFKLSFEWYFCEESVYSGCELTYWVRVDSNLRINESDSSLPILPSSSPSLWFSQRNQHITFSPPTFLFCCHISVL